MNKENIINRIEKYFDNISGEELLEKMKEHGFEEIPTVLHVTVDEETDEIKIEEGVTQ